MIQHGLTLRNASTFVVCALLAACAEDKLEHPSYWWNATVVSVERASAIPPGVDRDCVQAPTAAGPADERPVIVVHYKVGKSVMTKAYIETKGDRWAVGELAFVHPDTCRIKRNFTVSAS